MSEPPDERMAELRQLFFETAADLTQQINEDALRLEQSPGDAETTRSLRRTAHTLKGDAAACGFRELSKLCHQFEDVLAVGNPVTAALVPEIALRAADLFRALLHAYRTGGKLPDTQGLRIEIAQLAGPAHERSVASPREPRLDGVKAAPWSEHERVAIARAAQDGRQVYHIVVEIDSQCGMPIAARQMIQLALAGLGEVLALYPAQDNHDAIALIEAALASEHPAEQIRSMCNIPTIALEVSVTPVSEKALQALAPEPTGPKIDSERNQTAATAAVENGIADGPSEKAAARAADPNGADNLLRVNAGKVDSVLNLVGEMILAKSMLQQVLSEYAKRFPRDALMTQFSDAMALQGRVLNDLQHSVMKIRMVPVERLFRRFPRIARDVGRQCGKEVELAMRGGQTDLDKSILDAMAEPLTHLVRNAISHGIEKPEARLRAGKARRGTLSLNAFHQGNQVVIEVSDDGSGIDAAKVRQRALSLGLIEAGKAAKLSDAETVDLILKPGFSTAETITEISGRGVGLDVVQSVLQRLKGTIQIETAPGRGTTFRLRLPLTLAIIRALLFRVEQRLYALPLNAVAEIARTTEENIHEVEHYEVLQLRGDVLPLLRLGMKPAGGPEAARRRLFVLVIESGERRFGLVVDQLQGEGELVIKALDDQSVATDLVSGASILGDGKVVFILNLMALVDRFIRGRANPTAPRMTGILSGALAPRPAVAGAGQALGATGGRT